MFKCTAPPRARSGVVDLEIGIPPFSLIRYENHFTYRGTTTIDTITPAYYPVQPSDKRVTLLTRGVSDTPETMVYFGETAATEVVVEILGDSERITCLPPPFPGGASPLTVPVRVTSPFATATPLESTFQYGPVPPMVVGEVPALDAWVLGQQRTLTIDYLTPGVPRAEIAGVVVGLSVDSVHQITLSLPALPPGEHQLTLTNGDGGTYTRALEYVGMPSTDFHPGDADQDFRFNLSEVLRVVQFFNAGGYLCEAGSEDGYAPGLAGDRACAAYPSDNDPQDWQIGLPELMEIIQFYNLHTYQPCQGAPGSYCPPE